MASPLTSVDLRTLPTPMTAPPVLPQESTPNRASDSGAGPIAAHPLQVAAAAVAVGGAVIVGAALLWLLWRFEPQGQVFFPRCSFHELTGLQCPGCGGLRATHALLHGNLRAAWRLNPLLVLSLPAAAWTLGAWGLRRTHGLRLPHPLGFRHAWVVWLALLLGFGLIRNL